MNTSTDTETLRGSESALPWAALHASGDILLVLEHRVGRFPVEAAWSDERGLRWRCADGTCEALAPCTDNSSARDDLSRLAQDLHGPGILVAEMADLASVTASDALTTWLLRSTGSCA